MADRKPASSSVDARTAIEQFQDHLAPKLDVYEQAVYLYILRHSRLVGKPQVTIELKSLRSKIAHGLGKQGSRVAQKTCDGKLRSLDAKGCIQLLPNRGEGTPVRLFLPSEIPGLTGPGRSEEPAELEELDFFNVARNRRLILEREGGRCFYCLKKINESNFVIDHVVSRPTIDDSYRNVVATCRRCNNRKGESAAEDLLRVLYREGYVSADDLSYRLTALSDLRAGRLKPGKKGLRD
ncbi:MAG: HNH endonuclease [Planctomycetota bacterium]|jgi:hypothetical protein